VYNFLFSDHKVCIIIFKCCGSKVCIANREIIDIVSRKVIFIFGALLWNMYHKDFIDSVCIK